VRCMEIPAFVTAIAGFAAENGLGQIPEEHRLLYSVIAIIVNMIILTVVFYIAGAIVVGKRRALLSDAFVIALLGTAVSGICNYFFSPIIGAVLSLLVWLLLIRRYYETGWLGALAVGILAMIIAVVVSIVVLFILALLLGFTFVLFEWLLLFLVL
jgi:hypothetical protein